MEPIKKANIIKIVIIIIALLVIILILTFVAYPFYQKASATNQQIKIKRQEEGALKQRLEDLKELEKNYDGAKDKAKMAVLALPTEEQIPELLVQLENIASENAMVFLEISPGEKIKGGKKTETATIPKTTPGGIYQELPMTIKISGSFANLNAYLKSIENNIRILDVDSISIEKNIEAKSLDIDLAIRAYFQNKK
jgi:Tfp pilus assembly protein PilO